MSSPRILIALSVTATALGLYFTQGVLDQVEAGGQLVRVALLPGWVTLLASLAAAIGLHALIGWLIGADERDRWAALAVVTVPLNGLAFLAVPYLPLLPDRWPVLQSLAGSMAWTVWLVVAGLQGWVLWNSRAIPRAAETWTATHGALVVFIATVTVCGTAAWRLAAHPGGDEPHYLVISQSLWRDGDLNIFNNHQQGDYYEYSSIALEPHYLTPGIDGGIYSVHPILMPLLMAPVLAVGGYGAVVAVFVLLSSIAATLAWGWVRRMLLAPAAATFAWLAIIGSAPFLLNSFAIYPEICAAVSLMIAWSLMVATPRERPGAARHLAIGLACAALPWFSTKYAPMSAALVLVVLARLWHDGLLRFMREPKVWAVALPYAAALAGWSTFFYIYWGSPLPTAPYGDHGQSAPVNLFRGLPGLIFDQEYGVLAFAPVYILAATGLVAMWRAGGMLRRQAVEVVAVFTPLLVTIGMFYQWWGGSAAPGRMLASGLLLLSLPIAAAFEAAPRGSARRAAQHVLLWIGIGIAGTLVLAQKGLLIDNGRDGTASLLEFWSPSSPLWALVPTFTLDDTPVACLHAALWLTVAGGAAALLSRWRHARPGAAALSSLVVLLAALSTIALIMPLLPESGPRQAIDPAARSRLAALDQFDSQWRPSAVIYDPARLVPAQDVLPSLTLRVAPLLRADRTPVPLIHNGRFSLPAGRYAIDVRFSREAPAATLGLQVGRLGGPLEQWEVQPRAGEAWRGTFQLPVDANFVGFVGSPELEQAIAGLSVTATSLVDASARPQTAEVLSARKYREATLFFHDENLYPEREGMWLRGGRIATVTIVPPSERTTPNAMRINCGSRGNTATLTSPGWHVTHSLVPGQVAGIQLPVATRGVIPLTITATDSYRPRDIDPSSRDPRVLGVWLELTP